MVRKEVKEDMRARLSEVGKDLKESRVKTRINGIEKVDGKISANFSVSGLPHKASKGDAIYPGSYDGYRDIQKIFNNWGELSEYAEKFFSASDDDLIKMCEEY